ncbi:MAG: hypothetical protein HQ539_00485, partial [Parcubacteria group bacterium]|nr:hypothetical protein [Parcubacteria group bacterium]
MSKKKTLGLVVFFVFVAVVAGGLFWWNSTRVVVGNSSDYIITDIGDGAQTVSNDKAGLSFDVPAGWIVEKIEELEGFITIYTTNTKSLKSDTIEPPLENGCFIAIAIIYKEMNFEEMEEEINDMHFGLGVKSEKFETITINNQQALKNTYDTVFMGKGTAIYIPNKNKFYSFATYAGPKNEEKCLQDFDEFINS